MTKRGRPPKPTVLKLATGNPGKRALNEREPQPDALPSARPPAGLSSQAKKKWPEMVELLSRNGLFTSLDVDRLAIYCQAWADLQEAQRMLDKHGAVQVSKNGYETASPWVGIKHKSWKVMNEVLSEFGMGPASRSKVGVHAPRGNRKKTSTSDLLD